MINQPNKNTVVSITNGILEGESPIHSKTKFSIRPDSGLHKLVVLREPQSEAAVRSIAGNHTSLRRADSTPVVTHARITSSKYQSIRQTQFGAA